MDHFFLNAGIIFCVIGISSLLYAAKMRFVYRHTLDASQSFYENRRKRAKAGLIVGASFLGSGIILFLLLGGIK